MRISAASSERSPGRLRPPTRRARTRPTERSSPCARTLRAYWTGGPAARGSVPRRRPAAGFSRRRAWVGPSLTRRRLNGTWSWNLSDRRGRDLDLCRECELELGERRRRGLDPDGGRPRECLALAALLAVVGRPGLLDAPPHDVCGRRPSGRSSLLARERGSGHLSRGGLAAA